MMNLELLCWVSNNGGDERFRDIAIAHANTTLITISGLTTVHGMLWIMILLQERHFVK